MKNNPSLGFVRMTLHQAGVIKRYARFQCVECGEIADMALKPGVEIGAEQTARLMAAKGWVTHAIRKSRTYCPKCSGPSQRKTADDSEIRKVIPMNTPTLSRPVEVREPTADQRVRIRGLLDKHFDDSVGMYLDDMSDQKVAEAVGMPRIVVERMREAAYGPIKVDPEMAGIRAEIANLKRDVDGQQKGLDAMKAKVLEAASRLEKKLTGLAA